MLIDTHCHLDHYDENELPDLFLLMANISQITLPAVNFSNFYKVINISRFYNCFYALGIHPFYAQEFDILVLRKFINKAIQDPKFIGLGEIGLDFSKKNNIDIDIQKKVLINQLEIAQEFGLPVLIHSVKSHDTIFKILKSINYVNGGIIHAFHGSRQQADNFISLGFFIGVGGSITYLKYRKIRECISSLHISHLVLETDSPFMPPLWLANKRNHPKEITGIAKELADLKQLPLNKIESITTSNAMKALPKISRFIKHKILI